MDENINQTQQEVIPPTQPTVQTIPAPKVKKSIFLMMTIHLIAVAAIGYFVYQNIQLKKQISQPQPTPIAITTPTVLPTTDPTAGWATFTQKDVLPISFKYPENLVISVRSGDNPVVVIDTKKSIIPEMFDSPIAPIEIMLDLNSNTYIKAVQAAKEMFEASSLKVEILNNNGITGSLVTGNVIPGARSGRFVEAYFDNGTNPAIVFWYEGYSEIYKGTIINETVFTQIVKTVSLIK
jgi:hypothetical protein